MKILFKQFLRCSNSVISRGMLLKNKIDLHITKYADAIHEILYRNEKRFFFVYVG